MSDRSKSDVDGDRDPSKTRTHILRVAERLFAKHGIDGPTMRQITAAAGTSLNAVNYHFGSKLGLTYAVFEKLARQVSESRAAELKALKNAAGEKPIPLKAIIRAALRPYIEGDKSHRILVVRLIQQNRFSPSPLTRRIVETHFDPLAKVITGMLHDAAPHLSRRDIFWRYYLMIGTATAAVLDTKPDNRMTRLSKGVADAARTEELAEQALAFIVAGFEGPGTEAAQSSARPTSRSNGAHGRSRIRTVRAY